MRHKKGGRKVYQKKYSKNNVQLFNIIDEIDVVWNKIDSSFYVGTPNRLDKLYESAKQLEKLAIDMQKHIENMRRK